MNQVVFYKSLILLYLAKFFINLTYDSLEYEL